LFLRFITHLIKRDMDRKFEEGLAEEMMNPAERELSRIRQVTIERIEALGHSGYLTKKEIPSHENEREVGAVIIKGNIDGVPLHMVKRLRFIKMGDTDRAYDGNMGPPNDMHSLTATEVEQLFDRYESAVADADGDLIASLEADAKAQRKEDDEEFVERSKDKNPEAKKALLAKLLG
jgi:hypothetical protein